MFWVPKNIIIIKPLITVGLTSGTIIFTGIVDTADEKSKIIEYFWSGGIQNIQIPFYLFSACLAPVIMIYLKWYNGVELYVMPF